MFNLFLFPCYCNKLFAVRNNEQGMMREERERERGRDKKVKTYIQTQRHNGFYII